MNGNLKIEQNIRDYFQAFISHRKLEVSKQFEEIHANLNSLEADKEEVAKCAEKKQMGISGDAWPHIEELQVSHSESFLQTDNQTVQSLQIKKIDLNSQLRKKLEELCAAKNEEKLLQMSVSQEEEEIEMVTNLLNSIEKSLHDVMELECKLRREVEALQGVLIDRLAKELNSLSVAQSQFIKDYTDKKEKTTEAINELNEQDSVLMQKIWFKELNRVNISNDIKCIQSNIEEQKLKNIEEEKARSERRSRTKQNTEMVARVNICAEEVKKVLRNNC